MNDGDSKCIRCENVSAELEQGVCPLCRNVQATIAPTPGFQQDATIVPGQSSSESPMAKQVGDYDLIEEIARGGMGVVYKANHRNLNRVSALKMVLGGRFSSDEERQRFRIEAESAAKLDHPAIVPIFEIGEHDGQAFFVMKYIDGGSLAAKASSFTETPRKAAELMIKVAEGVHHAHQRGVLHRDLKPANILLDSDGEPYVTDLGLAKSTTGGSDLTHTGAVLGTPSYMPPEQAAGESLTTAADVYALGAILYELLVGRPPYQGSSSVNVVMQVIDGPPPPPHKANPDVDRDLELICLKSMAREPDQRYSSTQEMANDLSAWLAGDAISVKPPSMKAIIGNWLKQNQKLAYAVFALVAGIMFCAPIVIAFFSDDLSDVYSRFPDEKKPLLFSIRFPRWLSALSAIFLFLVLWPSIGLLNATISKPKSLRKSLWAGISTAAVLALIFYCLIGWMIFIQGATNASRSNISVLANAVWPDKGNSEVEAMKKANELFGGLDEIPEDQRAGAVTQRIRADFYASAPTAFGIGLMVAFFFSVPIVFGTMMGYVLQNRAIPIWLMVLRYIIAWWAIASMLVTVLLTIGYLLGANVNINQRPVGSHLTNVAIGVAVLSGVAWLALRKWRRKKPVSSAEMKTPQLT